MFSRFTAVDGFHLITAPAGLAILIGVKQEKERLTYAKKSERSYEGSEWHKTFGENHHRTFGLELLAATAIAAAGARLGRGVARGISHRGETPMGTNEGTFFCFAVGLWQGMFYGNAMRLWDIDHMVAFDAAVSGTVLGIAGLSNLQVAVLFPLVNMTATGLLKAAGSAHSSTPLQKVFRNYIDAVSAKA